MSDAPADAEAKPKKKGGLKKIIIMAVAAIGLVGGGVAGGMYAAGSGATGAAHAEQKEDPDRPKLVPKGEHGEHEGGPPPKGDASPEDVGDYKATYYPMETPFTANLSDADGFLQIGLGVSTYYDEKVIENLKENDMPVRSAVLMTLASESSDTLGTPEGKKHLQKVLTQTINQVLREKTGFGGIDDVYFTSFVMQ